MIETGEQRRMKPQIDADKRGFSPPFRRSGIPAATGMLFAAGAAGARSGDHRTTGTFGFDVSDLFRIAALTRRRLADSASRFEFRIWSN
jgi:hypothetical protein